MDETDFDEVKDPIIVINKIRDVKESRKEPITGYLKDEEFFLLNVREGKISKLRRLIENSSDYRDLRPCREILDIIDKMENLLKKYIDIQTIDEEAFKDIFNFVSDYFNREEKQEMDFDGLRKELSSTKREMEMKHEEVERIRIEEKEKRLVETNVRDFLEERAKTDPAVKRFMNRIQKEDKAMWDQMGKLGAPRIQLKESSDVFVDSQLLPNLSDRQWEMLKKIDYMRGCAKMSNGEKVPFTQMDMGAVLRLVSARISEKMQLMDTLETNPAYRRYLDNMEIEDEDFMERVDLISQGAKLDE